MGMVLDLLTSANTVPIMGNPWVSATCSHARTHEWCHLNIKSPPPLPLSPHCLQPAVSSRPSPRPSPIPCIEPTPSQAHHQAHALSCPALLSLLSHIHPLPPHTVKPMLS